MVDVSEHQTLDKPKPFVAAPVAAQKANWKEADKFQKISKIKDAPIAKAEYPFNELAVGEALYIPVEPNSTKEKLMTKLYVSVANARKQFSEVEKDENGDEIWDVVIVKTRLKNPDGSYQMDAYGVPMQGASQTSQPRLVFSRHYAITAVAEGDDLGDGNKAPHDGALVVRQV